MNKQLIVADTSVRQDNEGRYNLNDLHKAAGGYPKDKPSNFHRLDSTRALVTEISRCSEVSIAPISTVFGGHTQGTFVVKELVYAYAMWISPKFHLHVIRAYDQLQTQPQVPQSFTEALRLAADTQEKLEQEQQQKQIAQQRVSTYQKVTSKHSHTLNRFIRTLPGVNSQKIKHDLMFYGYLYRTSQTYKRYARFDHLFNERIDDEYGTVQIVPTEQGKQLLIDLYERGALTLKKSYQ